MAVGPKGCVTNKCSSCKCRCVGTGGHACDTCEVCLPTDNHTRK